MLKERVPSVWGCCILDIGVSMFGGDKYTILPVNYNSGYKGYGSQIGYLGLHCREKEEIAGCRVHLS
jgi:hypothetical protein